MLPQAQSRVETTIAVIWGVGIRLAAIAGLLYFLYRVRFVLITVLLAAILALAVAPVVDYLTDRVMPGVKRSSRRFIVTLVVFVLLILMVVLSDIYLFAPVTHEIADAIANFDITKSRLGAYAAALQAWYKDLPPDLRNFLTSQDFGGIVTRLMEGLRAMLTTTMEWITHAVDIIVIPVLAFYFVVDSRPLKREFMYLVPRRRVREVLLLLDRAGSILQAYAIGQLILCLIAAVVVGVGLKLLGVKYALTMGILAGVTRAIPIIGPIVGAIPIVLVSMAQSMGTAVAVLIFFSALHVVESKLIMPKLIGYKIHLHPAIVVIVLLIGSEFFGVLGMFLAAPIAAMLKCVYSFYVLRDRSASVASTQKPCVPPPSAEVHA